MTSSARPERRPGLPRRHPARAAAEAALQAEQGVEPQTEAASTAPPAAGQPAVDVDEAPAGGRARLSSGRVSYAGRAVTIYFPSAEDKDRAQAAFAARGGMEGYTSASEWMADVILERTEQWEKDYNNGRPFTEVLARRQARRRGR